MGLWLVINCGEKWLKNDRPVDISVGQILLDFANTD